MTQIESTIAAGTHGRYLWRSCDSPSVLVGFHGYGESAEDQMARLTAVAGSDEWNIVSIQGLHRFYERRTNRIVASWMTRQDRELAIADNVAYVARVIDEVLRGRQAECGVFAGFSQGVAMAFRAAATSRLRRRHVIAVGGDVPPELGPGDLAHVGSVLICRGAEDPWYGVNTFEADVKRLRAAALTVHARQVPGAHEWSPAIADAAARFLEERRSEDPRATHA